MILAAGALYFAGKINIGYEPLRVSTYGVFAFLIVWMFVLLEKNKIFILKGFFKALGDSSYTLYLTHTVLLGMFYTIGIRDYFVNIEFPMGGFVMYMVSIIIFSWVFYKLVELPLYTYTKYRLINQTNT
jgi:peptidoglycan/LPS O-acetylase OafA/YrhL